MLMVPFGNRRLLGVVVDVAEESDLPPERLAEPLAALEANVPPELVRLGLWVAQEYVSTPARGLALVLPPGTGTGAGRRMVARRSLAASITESGRQALEGGVRLGERQQAALEALREPSPRERARARHRLRPRRPAPAREARPRNARGGTGGVPPAGSARRGGHPCGDGTHRCPAARVGRGRAADGWPRPAGTAGCFCGASPGAGRPRSTCRPWPRPSNADGRRSCSCPRSPSPRRPPAASWSASATRWPCCTRVSRPASATTSGPGCAAARRACAWGRAPRCSPRSRTWG